jgi:NAD(P)-dependent dehydrogenase (short-subunit alcohol dehydrogenase family)
MVCVSLLTIIRTGSRGIGLYMATAFLQAGCAKVIITARDMNNLAAAVKELNALPSISGKAVAIAANAGKGRGLDILVANAAASWGGPFESFEDWKSIKTLELNVRGVFNLCRL